MKKLVSLLALVAALSFTCAAMAKDHATTKPAGLHGKVQSVDGMIITIKGKTGETAIQTDADTKFTLDGQPATLADVKAGERVVSATPDSGIATEVKLMSGRKNKPTTSPAAT